MEIEEYKTIIEQFRTIYVYGIYEDGTPYMILYTNKIFKPRLKSEGYVKTLVKAPLIIIEVSLKQYRVMENIKVVILPSNQEIKRFVEAIGDKGNILISLTEVEDFKDIYMSVAEKGFIEDKDYNAVTFEIPVDDLDEIKQLMKIINIIDRELMKRIEEILIEKQDKELKEIGIFLR
ncbi:MAG: hypothetical protein QXO82_06375 [Candidatus Methanomethylicia archaeon]